MSKFTKLVKSPRKFVRDSAVVRSLIGDPRPTPSPKASTASDRSKKEEAAKATPKSAPTSKTAAPPSKPTPAKSGEKNKAHPLPTLNLAEEMRITDPKGIPGSSEFLRFVADDGIRSRVIARIANEVRSVMVAAGFEDRDYERDVRDFLALHGNNPAAGSARTTAVGSLMWLFIVARAAKPRMIVESGVFKGSSLYALRSAQPNAEVRAFDIDLSNLVVNDPTIEYHEGDWAETECSAIGSDDLCYFDDHINNCLRIKQAADRGFRHLIFDDSPDIGQLHKWRYPGVPTIQMVMNGSVRPGETIEWTWKDRRLRYTHRAEHTHGAEALVEHVCEFPSLSHLTGRAAGIQTYVRLRAPRR